MPEPDPIAAAVAALITAIQATHPAAAPSAPATGGRDVNSGPRNLLTLAEAAEELRISRTQLYRLRTQGRIRVVRLGYRALVPYTEIERVIDDALRD